MHTWDAFEEAVEEYRAELEKESLTEEEIEERLEWFKDGYLHAMEAE